MISSEKYLEKEEEKVWKNGLIFRSYSPSLEMFEKADDNCTVSWVSNFKQVERKESLHSRGPLFVRPRRKYIYIAVSS